MSEPIYIDTENEMMALGATLAEKYKGHFTVIYLQGNLGMGKTTLVRGWLRALGYQGTVRSPSYGFIEAYEIDARSIVHVDLYRLGHPEEIEELALFDYLTDDAICLIEWPEKALNYLPAPTLCCTIELMPNGITRKVSIQVGR